MKTIVGSESQGKSLGKRLPAPRTSNMVSPGPGTYDAKAEASLLSSPGWKIGTSTRNDTDKQKMRNSNFPPPDTYNPLKLGLVTLNGVLEAVFAKVSSEVIQLLPPPTRTVFRPGQVLKDPSSRWV